MSHFLGGWLTITIVKGLQNLTWLFFSPSFLIKLPSLGKILAMPSLTQNLQKYLSYEVKEREQGGWRKPLLLEPFNFFHELHQLCTHHCVRRAMMSESISTRLRWKNGRLRPKGCCTDTHRQSAEKENKFVGILAWGDAHVWNQIFWIGW